MAFTIDHYRTVTRERLATVRLTVHVSAEQIALALMSNAGALYVHDNDVPVSEDAIREALRAMFHDGLENATYTLGDNSGADGQGDARHAEVTAAVVAAFFDGQQCQPEA